MSAQRVSTGRRIAARRPAGRKASRKIGAVAPAVDLGRNGGGLRPQKMPILLAQRIADRITGGELEPGTVLPPEREMLGAYGVGRGSLREALRLLEQHGLVTMKPGPGGGPVVRRPDPMHLASSLALLLQAARTPFRAIVEARVSIEPQMAAQAAQRASSKQTAEAEACVAEMGNDLASLPNFLAQNARFHDLIADASGNPVFRYLMTSLHRITDGTSLGVMYDERRRRAVHRAHERIAGALTDHDADAARDAMASHMGEFAKFMEKYYPSLMDRPIRWAEVVPAAL